MIMLNVKLFPKKDCKNPNIRKNYDFLNVVNVKSIGEISANKIEG